MNLRLARVIALSVFAIMIAGWVVAAVHLTKASAGRVGFPFNLSSKLAADYSSDESARISSLRISIVADFLKDLGLLGDSGEDLLADLNSPVPTATARNFAGDPPFTATVTPSLTPTESETPTATPSNTPKPAPSSTPKPTNTEEPVPTAAPTDAVEPTLIAGSVSPPAGALPGCSEVVTITNLQVIDPAPSSGIKSVQVKYKVGSSGYVYSDDFSPPVSGGWTAGVGSTWDAIYNGSDVIDYDEAFASLSVGRKAYMSPLLGDPTATPTLPPPTATPSPIPVELWAIAEDVAGNVNFIPLGNYTLPGSCGA